MYCENCGALLTGGGKFCPECGAAVNIKIQNQYKKELDQSGMAFAYLPDEGPAAAAKAGEQAQQNVPDYGYSEDTIRAAQAELDRPSKAEEYKKTSTDWRDHVDSSKFREQNANGQPVQAPQYTDQPFYNQPQYGYGQKQAPNMYDAYGTQYSDKSYIAAALLAFFLGAFKMIQRKYEHIRAAFPAALFLCRRKKIQSVDVMCGIPGNSLCHLEKSTK